MDEGLGQAAWPGGLDSTCPNANASPVLEDGFTGLVIRKTPQSLQGGSKGRFANASPPVVIACSCCSPGDGNYFNDLFIDSIASWIGVRKKYGIDPSSVRHPCGPTHNQLRTRWTEWGSVYPLRPPSEDCSLTDRIVGRRYLNVLRGIPSEGQMYDKENSVSNLT